MTTRTFDRVPQFDLRSRMYGIRAVSKTRTPRNRRWTLGSHLDQGSEGACVGFAWSAELAALPTAVRGVSNITARNVYAQAQALDGWPLPHEGSSVIAGAKAVAAVRLLDEYRWAFSLYDLLIALSSRGPAVLGVDWHESMMYPRRGGEITVEGAPVGGHAICAYGIDVDNQRVWLRNSWGAGWGVDGDCWVSWDDMALLLGNGGEACIPVRRRRGTLR